jgi:hypothetical protein
MTRALRIEIVVISAVFALLGVLGVIWDITSGLLASGIDGILLLAVCLMTSGIFALMMLVELQSAGIVPAFGGAKVKPAAAAPAAKPAAAAPAAKPATSEAQPTAQAK